MLRLLLMLTPYVILSYAAFAIRHAIFAIIAITLPLMMPGRAAAITPLRRRCLLLPITLRHYLRLFYYEPP